MFKTRGGGGVKGRLNNVKKTDDLVGEGFPKEETETHLAKVMWKILKMVGVDVIG